MVELTGLSQVSSWEGLSANQSRATYVEAQGAASMPAVDFWGMS